MVVKLAHHHSNLITSYESRINSMSYMKEIFSIATTDYVRWMVKVYIDCHMELITLSSTLPSLRESYAKKCVKLTHLFHAYRYNQLHRSRLANNRILHEIYYKCILIAWPYYRSTEKALDDTTTAVTRRATITLEFD